MGRTVVFSHRWMRRLTVWAGVLSLLVGCAQDQGPESHDVASGDPFFEDDLVGPLVPDPLEPVNRPVFDANMAMDTFFVDPVARAYGTVTPVPIKTAVRSVFANLNAPVVMVNEVLQLEGRNAAETLGRFLLNSTLGFGGIFNPAGEFGWDERHADFGQTLGKYGVGPGVYLVLPLLGPSTARDAVGTVVDLFLRIDTWLLPFQSQILLGGGFGISERESRRDELRALRESSIDFYAAVRSAYLQTRAAKVREAREGRD
jgi:phospholipid-binding lipoprotein MlaA